jgi:hypothetical protein
LGSNLGSVGWTLTDTQMARLNKASELTAPYPHDFVANGNQGR